MKPDSRLRRWLVVIASLILLYTLVGFFLLPAVARSQLEKRLTAQLGRRVTVERVRMNPYSLSLTVENFAIREPDGATAFLGWRRLFVDFEALASLRGEWVLGKIALDGFDARVALQANGSLSFSDVLARVSPPGATPPPAGAKALPGRPLRVASLEVTDSRINFSDASRQAPFNTVVGPLSFVLTGFRTTGGADAPYRFEAVTESGEKLAWSGTLQAEPLRSAGELTLENLVLGKYAPYYADQVQMDLVSGAMSVRGQYDISLAEGQRSLTLTSGALDVRNLKLVERATQQSALELPALEIRGVRADAMRQSGTVDSVTLSGGRVQARREKDGTINLLSMLQPPAARSTPATPTPAAGSKLPAASLPAASSPPGAVSPTATSSSGATNPATTLAATPSAGTPSSGAPAPATPAAGAGAGNPPDVTIGEVALKDFRIDVTDLAGPRPVQLALEALQVSLRTVSLAPGAQMPLQFAVNFPPQGTVRVGGTVGITPLKADLNIELAGLELLPLSPYFEQFANARLTQGAVTTRVHLEASLPDPAAPFAAQVTGDATVEKLGLVDSSGTEEIAGFTSLSLRGLRAGTTPVMSVALDEVNLAAPYARIVLNPDKTLNLAKLVPAGPAASGAHAASDTPAASAAASSRHPGGSVPTSAPVATSAAAPPATPDSAAAGPKIDVAKLVISEGNFRFTDRSIERNVSVAITHFSGTIQGLSSAAAAQAELDLKASVDGAGPVAITGKINPLAAAQSFDLKVDVKNVDLVPLSAYSAKYAGYELARGKLLLDVRGRMDGNKIAATNVITLNQFTFGNPVKSPEATNLPVRLGVALLKDIEGKIVLDVPVEGSLDDPNFGVGRVVMRVVGNILTKAAVSPFSLLGAAFGGGGDELAFQEFAPGSPDVQPAETRKLQTMAQALANRPALSLGLQGSYDAAADGYALQRSKFSDTLRRAVWETKRQADPNIAPPEQLVATPEETAAAIKRLYDEKFPPGTEFGAPLPKPPAVVTAPAAPKPGLLRRIANAVTFKALREGRHEVAEDTPQAGDRAQAAAAEAATGLPIEEMSGRLAEAVKVDDNDLRALAQARAQRVRDYFVEVGRIPAERLFLSQDPGDAAAAAKGPRVFLSLQ